MIIDKKSRIPLYAQLYDHILDKIKSGEWREHEKLPSEREICDTYGISRTTVRQTMIELENEGYIYKEHGKGSFVSPQTYTQSLVKFYSFSEEMKKLGKHPITSVIDFEITPCSSKAAKKLELEVETPVYKIKRLRSAEDEPIMIETTYLPVSIFPGLTRHELEKRSMYEIFRTDYQISLTSAYERFKAVSVKEKEAPHLDDKPGSPAMKIERTAYSDNLPVEYSISIARGDRYYYATELSI